MNNSEQIKWKDLVQLAGSLCMGTTAFLGLNYWLGDSVLAVSLSIGIVVFAATYGLVAILVKVKKAVDNRDRAKIVEGVTLFGYIVVALLAGIFTLHYLTVELEKKTGIKLAAENSLKEIGLISDAYKTQVEGWTANFKIRLTNAVRENNSAILANRGLTGASDANAINDAVKDYLANAIERIATTNKKYEDIEAEANTFKNKGLAAVEDWSYFSIMNTLMHIDDKKQAYIDDLLALSKQIPSELNDMEFVPPHTETMRDKLPELEEIDFPNAAYGLSIVVFIITNLMTLFPYIFGSREGMHLGKGKLEGGFTFKNT
jgi:hypothetical protein